MSSRAKKKRSTPPSTGGGADAEPSKGKGGWFEMSVGAIVLFAVGGGLGLEAFGSWKAAAGCGLAAALLAIVRVRRGASMF